LKVRSGACQVRAKKENSENLLAMDISINSNCLQAVRTYETLHVVGSYYDPTVCNVLSENTLYPYCKTPFWPSSVPVFISRRRQRPNYVCIFWNIIQAVRNVSAKKGSEYRRFVANFGSSMLLLVPIWAPRRIH
jgi:hypothetical protein